MKKILTIIIIIIIILGAVWYFMTTQPATELEDTMQTPNEITVILGEQNDSRMNGSATLTQMDNGLKVVLNLNDAPAGVSQPAHIHLNNCENIGGVKYPLNFPLDGRSETILNVTLSEILDSLPLSINVHKSAAEASVYVACGNITK